MFFADEPETTLGSLPGSDLRQPQDSLREITRGSPITDDPTA